MPATSDCRLCGSHTTREFLNRPGVPVHQNRVVKSLAAARNVARGDLRMFICEECGFVFNAAFDPSLLAYDENYDNSQTYSPAFQDYVDRLVRHLIDDRQVRGKRIVEIGCGKGVFLRQLIEANGSENLGWGYDPTYVGPETDLEGRLRFQKTFFDASCNQMAADTFICRHVIEHVPRPGVMLDNLWQAIAAQQLGRATVYYETPCVEWIFRNQVLWDFFYEHCSLFTSSTLSGAFLQAGFQVSDVRHIFNGQYLWLEASPDQHAVANSETQVDSLIDQAIAYGEAERDTTSLWRGLFEERRRRGGICLWGAGAKGVTLANLIDPEAKLIDCVVDLNPAKQRGFLPGSGHTIVSPAELAQRRVASALVLNPNYRQEIEATLARLAPQIELIDLPAPSHFQLPKKAA